MSTQSRASLTDRYIDTKMTLLHFMVHDLQCCLPITAVDRMMSLLEIQAIPGGPDYLLGMMNLHGTSVSVIDLGLRIGHPQVMPYSIETPIILCCHNNQYIGLVVTEILEIKECDAQALQVRPEFKQGAQPYEAVINTGQGLSLLLDLERIGGVQLGGADILTRLTDVEMYGAA